MRPVLTFREMLFPTDPRKFSPSKISRYTVAILASEHTCVDTNIERHNNLHLQYINFVLYYYKLLQTK